MKNIEIIETILQIVHEDNLEFLTPNDSLLYKSDSDSDDGTDSTISTSSDATNTWKAAEREERINERVNEALKSLNEQYHSQYVSTDWEGNAFTNNGISLCFLFSKSYSFLKYVHITILSSLISVKQKNKIYIL